MLVKSAVDTKLSRIANTLEDRNNIQNDLDRMEHWTESNRMKFSKDKCETLHLRKRNQLHSYKMGDTWLSKIMSEKDLGAVINQKLNIIQQFDVAAKKGKCYFRLR